MLAFSALPWYRLSRALGIAGALTAWALLLPACTAGRPMAASNQLHVPPQAETDRWESTPKAVRALVDKVASPKDVIRAYWFVYPHGDKAGYRVEMQTNSHTWTELWSSGEVISALIEGRAVVNNAHGTLLLRLGDAPSDVQVEAFIPDTSNQTQISYFRVRKRGVPGDWGTLSRLYLIK